MAIHIDIDDPKYRNAAAEILRRHQDGGAEANITSTIRDFLLLIGLARSEEMREEAPPSDGSRRAVDLTALDTFTEFKRHIGRLPAARPIHTTLSDRTTTWHSQPSRTKCAWESSQTALHFC